MAELDPRDAHLARQLTRHASRSSRTASSSNSTSSAPSAASSATSISARSRTSCPACRRPSSTSGTRRTPSSTWTRSCARGLRGRAAPRDPAAARAGPAGHGAGRQGRDGHQGRSGHDRRVAAGPLPRADAVLRLRGRVARSSPTTSATGCTTSSCATRRPASGVIVRTAAQGASERDLSSDLEFLTRLWKRVDHQATEALAPEVIYTEMDLALRLVRDVFSRGVPAARRRRPGNVREGRLVPEEDLAAAGATASQLYRDRGAAVRLSTDLQRAIDGALRRTVALPSGGYLTVDKTEALTAIDVNTGRFVGKRNLEETILRTNLEAAEEVVRQLRLRDIGGIIIVDFIDMEEPSSKAGADGAPPGARARPDEDPRERDQSAGAGRDHAEERDRRAVRRAHRAVPDMSRARGGWCRETTRRIVVERRMREILRLGEANAYLFGSDPATLRARHHPA